MARCTTIAAVEARAPTMPAHGCDALARCLPACTAVAVATAAAAAAAAAASSWSAAAGPSGRPAPSLTKAR